MTPEQLTAIFGGIAVVISAIGGVLTTLVLRRAKRVEAEIDVVKDKTTQIEKQGNSVSLELKRTNMVYARRLAEATKKPGDKQMADDAQRVYEEAERQNAKL